MTSEAQAALRATDLVEQPTQANPLCSALQGMEIDVVPLCTAPGKSSVVGVVWGKDLTSIFATFQHVGVHQYDVRCFPLPSTHIGT